MIDIKSINQNPFIEITFNGKMTKEDVEKARGIFEQKITEQEPINLLLHAENLEGVTLNGLWEDTKMAKYLRSVGKVAIISDKEWLKVDAKLENLFPGVEVEYFTTDKQNAALTWLKS